MAAITEETLRRYCQEVFDFLMRTAEPHNDDNGREFHIWEGRITEVFNHLSISNAHYSRVLDTLYALGSMEQLRRGARNSPTQMALYERPEGDLPLGTLTRGPEGGMLAGRVRNLERRLEGIDLREALLNMERRLQALERTVKSNGT